MRQDEAIDQSSSLRADRFETTRWSVVLAAGQSPSPDASEALASLCQTYWYPLYAYVRRRVHDVNEAQDLTQAFFTEVLDKNYLAVVQPEKGRFRSFLLTAFKHFLSKEWDKARAQKRGGGAKLISLDFNVGESRYKLELKHDLTPELVFEKQWAVTLLENVMARLRKELVQAGKEKHFDTLKVAIFGLDSAVKYAPLAAELGMKEGATRMVVMRMRRRYQELLRIEISQTVAEPAHVDEEIQTLFATFAS